MTGTYYVAKRSAGRAERHPELMVDRRFLKVQDRVLIIDDFRTGCNLNRPVSTGGRKWCRNIGIGCVIEKPEEEVATCSPISIRRLLRWQRSLHEDGLHVTA